MSQKSNSKPMTEILRRLTYFEYIKPIIFPEKDILKKPIEEWPVCNCLISFYSNGFPLEKAVEYVKLRKPYVINDLEMQFDMQNRSKIYSFLEKEGIPLPRYAICNRESLNPEEHDRLTEFDDSIEINGIVFEKPFVEKPMSAEDHNICIYYPSSAGGGCQKLFRKSKSKSSIYSSESRVRQNGSYIYEDFMPTDGIDVKVYTVGPNYAHAEARKAPALDGKVERGENGKEMRYPVMLTVFEKLIARKVCQVFKQKICGFDLLRANDKSYVCDVNGFSFVKSSQKYYDDFANIIGNMVLRKLAPFLHIPWEIPFQLEDPPIVPTTAGKMMELRCVIAVIRHGDRTSKQKIKLEVQHPLFFTLFEKYDGHKNGQIKLKNTTELFEILTISKIVLSEIESELNENSENNIIKRKLEQVRAVLEMSGRFSEFNRKVQLKYQPEQKPTNAGDNKQITKGPTLILVLKWGGELTPEGRQQAETLGKKFHNLYPGGQDGTTRIEGRGLLRLHSSSRQDLKIYATDEGRVQKTAAAFTKGLLDLEGKLTPILAQMVKSANTHNLIDDDHETSKIKKDVKIRLHALLQVDREFSREDHQMINPCGNPAIESALNFIVNPFKCCEHILKLIQQLNDDIQEKRENPSLKDKLLYFEETWELMALRWGKLEKDFNSKEIFNISNIPDIYDCAKYDIQHNYDALNINVLRELYMYSKNMANVVIPQEFGITKEEKLKISQGTCSSLLRKIRADLFSSIRAPNEENDSGLNLGYSDSIEETNILTRLYFTSESHIHSLFTILTQGGLKNCDADEQWRRAMKYVSKIPELSYFTQIVIMAYEDTTKDLASDGRFHIELLFSPGMNWGCEKKIKSDSGLILPSTDCKKEESSYRNRSTPSTMLGPHSTKNNACHSKQKTLSPGYMSMEALSKALSEDEMLRYHGNLFSTAVISGLSCDQEFPPSVNLESIMEGVPPVCPLETLHNSLSLTTFVGFLDYVLSLSFQSPASSNPSKLGD
ncbi:inositol hexakisphosphate and diphosphoinositol-pentakisphosphate kinase-like [Artemia franciscana]